MGFYSTGMHAERSLSGWVFKILGIPLVVFLVACAALFFFCDKRLERKHLKAKIQQAQEMESVAAIDGLLLPTFEKSVRSPTKIVYEARPTGTGLCSCAPAMVEVLEVRYEGDGVVSAASAYQTLGRSTGK